MLVVGTAVAVAAAKRGQVPELPPPLEFLAVPLGNLAIFAVLVAVGLYNRRKRDSHKRLMMLNDRDSGRRARSPLVAYWRACVFESAAEHIDVYEPDRRISVGLLLYDLITRGRVHSAFLWSAYL